MSSSHLHEILEATHEELERAESVGAEDRKLLLQVMADIRTLLERHAAADRGRPAATREEQQSVVDGLEQSVWRFEETHPKLTTMLGQLIDGLGRTFR